MQHLLRWMVIGLFGLTMTVVALAQGGGRQGGGRGFQNLQVLPKDMPPAQVIQMMDSFQQQLGVTCEYCHADFGRGNPMTDLASDAKQPKRTARVMMRAMREFNSNLTPEALGKASAASVTCGTCHRGKPVPDYVPPAPPAGGR